MAQKSWQKEMSELLYEDDVVSEPKIEEEAINSNKKPVKQDDKKIYIPPKLKKFLTEDDIRQNVKNYQEMQYDLPEELVEDIKKRLMGLYLVHVTSSTRFSSSPVTQSTLYDEPIPYSHLFIEGEKSHKIHNTYKFDQDLDLDEFVFLSWGDVISDFIGGRYAILISPQLLLSSHCLVTPDDAAWIIGSRELEKKGFDELGEKSKKEFTEEYLNKIVTGKDWLEIQARRIAKTVVDGMPLDKALELDTSLGEVKFLGPIPRGMIIGTLDLKDRDQYRQYWQYVRETTGFILEKPKNARLHLIKKFLSMNWLKKLST